MDLKIIKLIENNKITLLASIDFPFLNIKYLENLNIPIAHLPTDITKESVLIELGEYSNFKNITFKDIINLRILLYLDSTERVINNWGDKIQRYIEINYSILRQKENRYGNTLESSVVVFNQLIAFFSEYYIYKNDLLFLNTALKISDLEWVNPPTKNSNSINVLRTLKLLQLKKILHKLENE